MIAFEEFADGFAGAADGIGFPVSIVSSSSHAARPMVASIVVGKLADRSLGMVKPTTRNKSHSAPSDTTSAPSPPDQTQ